VRPVKGGLPWYNGFSPQERRATLPIQRAAVEAGTLVLPSYCSICTAPATEWHDEDYRDCLNPFPTCRRCHRAIHARFDDVDRWYRFITAVSKVDQWVRQLTTDRRAIYRPFDLTYPQGICRLDV